MGHPLPVEFRWMPALPDLYIRATPLFSLPQHSQDHVVRCLNHSSRTDNSNKGIFSCCFFSVFLKLMKVCLRFVQCHGFMDNCRSKFTKFNKNYN